MVSMNCALRGQAHGIGDGAQLLVLNRHRPDSRLTEVQTQGAHPDVNRYIFQVGGLSQ